MNELLRQYVELTEVDRALVQTREQLERYPAMLTKMEAEEGRQRKAIAEAEARIEASRAERRRAEKEVLTLREQIRKYTAQQSSVKTNKEYEAITGQIALCKEKIDELETAGLEKLELEEKCAADKQAAEKALAALKTENDAERERIRGQIIDKRARLERLTSERERKLAALPGDEERESYTLLNGRFPGSVCAPVEGDSCAGCHWSLVPHIAQAVRRGEELVRCDHCRRILYWPEALR